MINDGATRLRFLGYALSLGFSLLFDSVIAQGLNPKLLEANAAIDAKDWLGTLKLADEVLELKPEDPEFNFIKGRALHELGKASEARAYYDKSITVNPGNSRAYSNRAILKGSTGDMKGALKDLDMAIRLNPSFPQALSNRGVVNGASGDVKSALRDFERSVRVDPAFVIGWKNLGITRELTGDIRQACSAWKKAADLGDSDAIKWVALQCQGKL